MLWMATDSFGGQSPEKKAATSLRTLFTFVAVRIILAQVLADRGVNLPHIRILPLDQLP